MRVAIFIDGITLFHSMKDRQRDRRINFNDLREWLVDGDELTYAEYVTCVKDKSSKLSFFGHIFKSGFIVNIFNSVYNRYKDEYILHGVDMAIAINAMDKVDEYDKIILVSGKHDFLPLCEKLEQRGKDIEIVGFYDVINNDFNKYKLKYLEDFY